MRDFLVVTTSSPEETAAVQELLKNNGIRSYAQTDATSEGLEALEGGSPFGNKIYVSPDDFEKARDLVDAFFSRK
ncbi:MAG: DUF2007 domain-containing protein [Clostridia bacterium]|nr:DUF2007 domain-containing protein [Clostridia bacterium]